jgi:hypothetical protein
MNLFGRLLPLAALAIAAVAQTPQTVPLPILKDDQVEIDAQPSRAFMTSIRSLLNQEDFDQLEQIATTARSTGARFTGGGWKIRYLYNVLQDPGSQTVPDITWTNHIERLKRWAAAKPQSITPRVALGSAYVFFGWKARGTGTAGKVTADGWKVFNDRLQQAREVLEEAETLPAKDPQLYTSLQWVAMAQGWSRSQVDVLLEQELMTDPGYFYFYNGHVTFLLPKWHGKAGDAEVFAHNIADRIGGDEGNIVYFRIASDMNCCTATPDLSMSWQRTKLGFAALERLYSSTNEQRNKMAFLATREEDQEFAQEMFSRIGNDWSSAVWGLKEKFDAAKAKVARTN